MPLPTFLTGKSYNLTTLAPAVLGTSYNRVVHAGSLSYDMARLFNASLDITHAKVVASSPGAGIVPDAAVQTYLIFHNESDVSQKVVLAKSWISTASESNITTANISVVLRSNDTLSREALNSLLLSLPSVIDSYKITYA